MDPAKVEKIAREKAAPASPALPRSMAVGMPKRAMKIVVCTRSSTWTLPQCVVTNLIVRWALSIDPPNRSIRSLATGF
jgi:hypothetical protein